MLLISSSVPVQAALLRPKCPRAVNYGSVDFNSKSSASTPTIPTNHTIRNTQLTTATIPTSPRTSITQILPRGVQSEGARTCVTEQNHDHMVICMQVQPNNKKKTDSAVPIAL